MSVCPLIVPSLSSHLPLSSPLSSVPLMEIVKDKCMFCVCRMRMRAVHPVGVPLRRVCLNLDESSRVPLTLTYPQVSSVFRAKVLALIRKTLVTQPQNHLVCLLSVSGVCSVSLGIFLGLTRI